MSSSLPRIVLALCNSHDAWIIGSAAVPGHDKPRDFDVVVSYSNWGPASCLIPPNAKPNRFGGWKCADDGVEVDVWPGELAWLAQNHMFEWAWHPRTGVRFKKIQPGSGHKVCKFCGGHGSMYADHTWLCEDCNARLMKGSMQVCSKCGTVLVYDVSALCYKCLNCGYRRSE